MQQRSGSATSSPHTYPPHARARSDSNSLHSLQLGTPSSSDRERPTTPSSSASSEQARLRDSTPGSHQGTARVLRLTSGKEALSEQQRAEPALLGCMAATLAALRAPPSCCAPLEVREQAAAATARKQSLRVALVKGGCK